MGTLQRGIQVQLIGANVIEWRGAGDLRAVDLHQAFAATQRILDEHPSERFDRLSDGSAITSYEPGLPMLAVRWALGRMDRFRRSAIVGRPGPMLAVARTFQYLLPKIRYGVFPDRQSAFEFLELDAIAAAR